MTRRDDEQHFRDLEEAFRAAAWGVALALIFALGAGLAMWVAV